MRVNIDKTESIWIGSKKGCGEEILPHKSLKWNHAGRFKLLGIWFELAKVDKTICNFYDKIKTIKSLLNTWTYRELTYIGRITVIKTLALPILVQVLTVLPNPPDTVLKEIQNIFFNFLWNGKPDKIKRSVIINDFEEGGLKLPDIVSFCYSLKFSWLHKLLDPQNYSPWKILLIDYIHKWGGDHILYVSSEGLRLVAQKLNSFWRDVFINFSILKDTAQDPNDLDVDSILKQPLWLNTFMKIGGNLCIKPKFSENGIFFINDLISDNNRFYSYDELKREYNVNVNFLEYYSIISAIPNRWKTLIVNCNKLPNIENKLIDFVKNNAKNCKYVYKLYLEKKKDKCDKCST